MERRPKKVVSRLTGIVLTILISAAAVAEYTMKFISTGVSKLLQEVNDYFKIYRQADPRNRLNQDTMELEQEKGPWVPTIQTEDAAYFAIRALLAIVIGFFSAKLVLQGINLIGSKMSTRQARKPRLADEEERANNSDHEADEEERSDNSDHEADDELVVTPKKPQAVIVSEFISPQTHKKYAVSAVAWSDSSDNDDKSDADGVKVTRRRLSPSLTFSEG